ncbi:50S ribosomal protein L22 [Candidatus Woesearchaeota archaeon]|nr:50S ribosomal protein L22 [Candidatus Woesearchaeota archaeon]
MAIKYSAKGYNKEYMAKAIGRSLPISFKHSVEICNFIRGKDVNYAKDALSRAITLNRAIPFRRFNKNVGHKKGIMSGRYPKKASTEILKLINSVESNAQFKGMKTSNLEIIHISANMASKVMHYGRKRSRWAKRTNVEIVVQERAKDKKSNEKIKEKKNVKGGQRKAKQNKNPEGLGKETKAKEGNKPKK